MLVGGRRSSMAQIYVTFNWAYTTWRARKMKRPWQHNRWNEATVWNDFWPFLRKITSRRCRRLPDETTHTFAAKKSQRNPHGGLRRSSKSKPTRALSCLSSPFNSPTTCVLQYLNDPLAKVQNQLCLHLPLTEALAGSLLVVCDRFSHQALPMACTVSIKIKLLPFLYACTTVFIVGCTSLIDKNYMMKSLEICTNWGRFGENHQTTAVFTTSCLADILTRSRSAPKSLHVIQSDGKLSHFHVQRKSHQKMALVGECTSYKLPESQSRS